jgi:thioredoxin reductase (NADPH)
MPDAIIIGDGPGGLSAALFLAKNGLEVLVFGQDKTAMHAAMLFNYLGIEAITGTDFQRIARKQVAQRGATLRDERVASLTRIDDGFVATTEGGDEVKARYVILSEGKSPRLALAIGLKTAEDGGIPTDDNGHTAIPGAYVVGRSRRPGRSQAIISAGDGAAAAIDILSRERSEDVCDWDVPSAT